jgi:hypothetical protein
MRPRRALRSVAAVFLGSLVGAALSLGSDEVLHVLEVYPPWGQPMHEPGLNFLALSYRLPFGVVAGWVIARLAPSAPMRHARVGGLFGTVLSALGVIPAIRMDLGPAWYPIALAVSAVPCTWLGAVLEISRRRVSR